MKANIEQISNLERRITITVDPDEVNKAFSQVYSYISKNVKLDGFRKGKVPMDVLKSKYQGNAQEDVVNSLVQSNLYKAFQENDVYPISEPEISVGGVEEGKEFTFNAQFEIRPEVNLNKIKGLEAKKEIFEFDEKRYEEVLTSIRERNAEKVAVFEDRGLIEGDIAIIDFDGIVNGAPLENGSAKDFELEIGQNQFIPGFEEGLVGAKPSDSRTLNLSFPNEYHVADLAGQPVTFDVQVKSIKKKVLPDLNDELATKLGMKSIDDLKDAVKNDIEESDKKRIKDDLKNRLLKTLVENNPVEVPPTMLSRQREALINDFQQRMTQQGLSKTEFEEYKTKWYQDFTNTASEMIQANFLVNQIADVEKLSCSEEEYETRLQEYAAQTGIEIDRVKEYYAEENRKGTLMYQITEDKVIAFLEENGTLKEVPKTELLEESNNQEDSPT